MESLIVTLGVKKRNIFILAITVPLLIMWCFFLAAIIIIVALPLSLVRLNSWDMLKKPKPKGR
jgi:hypothetical protein